MDAALDESSPIREALRNRGFCIEIRHPSTHRAKFAANPASQIRTRMQQRRSCQLFLCTSRYSFPSHHVIHAGGPRQNRPGPVTGHPSQCRGTLAGP